MVRSNPNAILVMGSRAIPHETSIRDVQAQTESRSVIQAIVPGLHIPDDILQADSLGRYRPRIVLDGDDGRPVVELDQVASEASR